mmetsp:Transcript_7173/g.29685  ORF Transcript_7173/g.29685 Transcript_7173/m.29685 type:complete len:221 (-) Transcript_7173:32-694(-)
MSAASPANATWFLESPPPPFSEAEEMTRTALTVARIPAGATATVSPARTEPASTFPPTAHGPKKRSPAPTSSDAGNRSGIGRQRSGSGIASIAATRHKFFGSSSGYHDRNDSSARSRSSLRSRASSSSSSPSSRFFASSAVSPVGEKEKSRGTRFVPSAPETGVQATASSANPLFRRNGARAPLISSKRACEYAHASILLTATIKCSTPRDRAKRTCSRV